MPIGRAAETTHDRGNQAIGEQREAPAVCILQDRRSLMGAIS